MEEGRIAYDNIRNVIYLLHRIPREVDEPVEKELELLTRATTRGQNIYVIKEGLGVNDRIILEGIRQVRDGEKVEFELVAPEVALNNLKYKAEYKEYCATQSDAC